MRSLVVLCLAAVALGHDGPQTPVGTWKYDVSSLEIVPNKEIRADLKNPKTAKKTKAMVAQIKSGASQTLKGLRIVFKADQRMTVLGDKGQQMTSGTWSMAGSTIKLVMMNIRQPTPQLTLSKDKKRIHATISEPAFGTVRVDLVGVGH